MKKWISLSLLCFIILAMFAGCANQTAAQQQASQSLMIANPWSDWDTLKEAETAVGFSFGLPEVIAEDYEAVSFRTMNKGVVHFNTTRVVKLDPTDPVDVSKAEKILPTRNRRNARCL